jgi:predicted Zn-dependent peptidase
MISAERYKLPADYLQRAPLEFGSVTPDDVQRVARKHLHPGACCVAAAGPVKRDLLRRALFER